MNSTNDIDNKIKSLFEGLVLGNSNHNYLQSAIDKNAASYYEEPKHPGQVYFSFIDTASSADLEKYLGDFWSGLGTPEFAPMAGGLAELVRRRFSVCLHNVLIGYGPERKDSLTPR